MGMGGRLVEPMDYAEREGVSLEEAIETLQWYEKRNGNIKPMTSEVNHEDKRINRQTCSGIAASTEGNHICIQGCEEPAF